MSTFSPAIREFLAAPEATRRLGPYRCKEPLDKSGTAPVFKAVEEHAGLNLREVAVKVFDIGKAAGGGASEGWQARVVDEARSLCRVQHPNVVHFHTLATDPKRGLMGLVMEFADGVSVERQLHDVPAADPRRLALAVEIGINISSALAAAHEAGIVHCNVKPSNIMFTGGTHKLINFGIAASLRANTAKNDERRAKLELDDLPESIGKRASMLDASGAESGSPISGTIGYVDPVCVRTMSLPTAASDLYSLGATLYQCIAGDVPAVATAKHRGTTGVEANVIVGESPAAPLGDVAPSAPPELAKLIDALVAPTREARPRSADAVRRSLERIRSALAGRERALPPETRGPFPGLDKYEAGDRDVFFGRAAEMAGLIELLRTRGLVGVVGLSGSGKSSLTRAGVVPAIEEGALEGWPAKYRSALVSPGTDLKAALTAALSKLIGAPLADHPEAIAEQLAANVDETGEGIVILVDPLDEIVTLHDAKRDKTRAEALGLLSRVGDGLVGLRVIVVARADHLDAILSVDAHFGRALSRGMQPLSPLTNAGWEEVIDQSLEAYGYRFDDDDVRREILKELQSRSAAMPLAQFGLRRLWAARDEKTKTIPRAAFSAKEGMRGALEHHAATTVAALKFPQDKLRDLLLSLTTPEGTRAHVPREDLIKRFGEPAKEVIRSLMSARLVVEESEGMTLVHDSIIQEWGLLRSWIADARDDRVLVAHLERDAARWAVSKDPAELWRKGRLAAAIELWRRKNIQLTEAARQFLTKSHREERKVKNAIRGLIFLVVALVVGSALLYAKESAAHAAQARRDADALAALLAEVKVLKQQAEENGLEAAVTAGLLHDLQKKMAEERASFGANVAATLKKVVSATNLDNARKATADLDAPKPAQNRLVPLPMDLTGPSAGPAAGAGTFDQAGIERVVNSRKAGVKRTCLERSSSTASSTKVTTTLTIGPTGNVQSVTSESNDPAVAKCIEQQVSRWTFPAPGEVKQVQIPFVFVRQ